VDTGSENSYDKQAPVIQSKAAIFFSLAMGLSPLRSTILPSLSTMNFAAKFQLTSPPPAVSLAHFHTGCVFGPLTSIFSITRNFTPLSAVNLQICSGEPDS
jgi:hypothetical protein